MELHPLIATRLAALRVLAAEHEVRSVAIIGSGATAEFEPDRSDIDLLVDFGEYTDDLGHRAIAFYRAVQELFERRVDVLSAHGIRNPTWRRIHSEQQVPVYAAA